MRIIQVVNVRWFNATAWYGLFLSQLLKKAGHEVIVLGLGGTESFAKAEAMGLSPLDFDLNSANPVRAASCLAKLDALLSDFQPHIVNCHRGEGMILWGLLKCRGHKFALVRTRGDQRAPKANVPNKILHGRMTEAVIATNSRTQEACVRLLGLPPEKVHLVLGGVDNEKFRYTHEGRQTARSALGFTEDDLVIGLLGRFDPVKGQKELIETIENLRSGSAQRRGKAARTKTLHPEEWRTTLRLLLAGFPTSTSQEEVESWLDMHHIRDISVISGKYDDVPGLISAMDIGVIASQGSEAIARAAFEIMSCEVPLVGTNVGVMPDLLPEYALVDPKDIQGLTDLLEKLISNPRLLDRLREEESKRIQTLTMQDFLRQTLRVYTTALRRAGLA